MSLEKEITPETRRMVIRYANRENITFSTALECLILECLILEGAKAICADNTQSCPLVHKPVSN